MKESEEKVLITVLKNMIESGKHEQKKIDDYTISKNKELDAKWKFLDEFWQKHKKEFIENGFEDCKPYDECNYFEIKYHPLSMAYNELQGEGYWLNACECKENRIQSGREKMYLIDGHDTTGPVSYKDLSSASGISSHSIKNLIEKLEKENIIKRSMLNNIAPYYYWMVTEETPGKP